MIRVKNIIKIITLIAIIVAVGYTFINFMGIAKPTGTVGIYITLYFFVIILAFSLKLMPDKVVKLNKIKDKVDYNEFKNIYQELLIKYKQELDKYRIKILIKRITQVLLATLFIVTLFSIELGWIVYLNRDLALLTPYIAIGTVLLLFVSFFANKSETMYKKLYKEKIIGNLIKSLGEELSYTVDQTKRPMVLNAYSKAEFDVTMYNRSKVDDYISGKLEKDLPICVADVHLWRIIKSGKSTRTINIFSGMFADITTTKNINATIKILANKNRKHSKIDVLSNKCYKLEMDSQIFEKYFNVYSDNKIITMQLLTSEILEMLIELRDTFGVDLEIVIDHNHIYLRFHTGSMFEARIFGNSVNEKDLLTYYGVLEMVILISKKINEMIVNSDV